MQPSSLAGSNGGADNAGHVVRQQQEGDSPAEGTERVIDGRLRTFYGGYWLKAYPIPEDTLVEKQRLIAALTRRLFNHVEHGLYVPGVRLEEARSAYANEE